MSEGSKADEREGLGAVAAVGLRLKVKWVIVLVVNGKATERGGVDCNSGEYIARPNGGSSVVVADVVYQGP